MFIVKVPAVSKHLKNIFESGELDEDSVVSILEITAADCAGSRRYEESYLRADNNEHKDHLDC